MHGVARRRAVIVAFLVLTPLVGAGCTGGAGGPFGAGTVDVRPLVHVPAAEGVDPTKPLTVTAEPGSRLTDVTLIGPEGQEVAGKLADDQRSWQTTGLLWAGTKYLVRVAADNGEGGRGEFTAPVATAPGRAKLTAELGPDSSGKGLYGVGQPLTVKLSEPIKDSASRKEVERSLRVVSEPAVTGAWYWVDDRNLHFRPEKYWPAHATIKLSFDRPGGLIADGLYVGDPVSRSIRIGDRVEVLIDAAADYLTYRRNGEVINTIPVTTGKPGYSTRNGIKVVLGQESTVRMKSETIGIAEGSSEAFDMDVHWATRVTWSGEYVHAAPWSVAWQGVENVSHGCTGMSTENARWFFGATRVGDVVQVVNSLGKTMEPFGNGFGDWNVSWGEWVKHSALGRTVNTAGRAEDTAVPGVLLPQI
ncbi:Ig-like domain-containing protein [Kitasatospora sp. GP82]|uniref:L,D-transpeptidase n=1 Tax=Kitasatospora sp. GP82 TaxID=3035089 RepID=UPI002474ADC9|nr:Ig-like domain-containing protein [Kitasatospora sp. GP82]